MMYYNYHAQAKRLISSGHLLAVTIFDKYRHIAPAMVLYFDNHKPMPIREYKWKDYFELISWSKIEIIDHRELGGSHTR